MKIKFIIMSTILMVLSNITFSNAANIENIIWKDDYVIEFTEIENALTQSLSAGWVNGSQYNSTSICVNINDAKKARQIINEYLDNTNE